MTSRRSFLALVAAAPVAALAPSIPAAAEPEPEIVLEHRFDAEAAFFVRDAAGRPLTPGYLRAVRCAKINGTWVLVPGRGLVADLDAASGFASPPMVPQPIAARMFAFATIGGTERFAHLAFARDAAGRWTAEGKHAGRMSCQRDEDPLEWALGCMEEEDLSAQEVRGRR